MPSFVAVEDMYIMSSTPFTCCSIGAATVSATIAGVRPGVDRRHLDRRRGDVRVLRDRQRRQRRRRPARVTRTDSTVAKIGRSMKKRVNMFNCGQWTAGRSRSEPRACGHLADAGATAGQRPRTRPAGGRTSTATTYSAASLAATTHGCVNSRPCVSRSTTAKNTGVRKMPNSGHADHPAEHRHAQRLPHLGPGPAGHRQRQHARA